MSDIREAELEMGRLRARIWRLGRTVEQWDRYASHLEQRIKLAQEDAANPEMWAFDPATDRVARWFARGAD